MRFILVTIHYFPMRTSASVQMRDLGLALVKQGHQVLILTPVGELDTSFEESMDEGMQVLRVRAPINIDQSYAQRLVAEIRLSGKMWKALIKSRFGKQEFDAVVWYSPTIFFGSLINKIKRKYNSVAYLVLRDIFPEWTVHLGLLRKGPVYYFLRMIAEIQYRAANVIGVQTHSNLSYVKKYQSPKRQIEVLNNWLSPAKPEISSIQIADTELKGRKILVYTGNIGVAQSADIFVDLAMDLNDRNDIGFLFVGRGRDYVALKNKVSENGLSNFLIHDEIPAKEIPALLQQCSMGLVALHPGHETHNIPGKFVSYMHAGLPVLARVNAGNDLVSMICENDVGAVYSGYDIGHLRKILLDIIDNPAKTAQMAENCIKLAHDSFSAEAAAMQVSTSSTLKGSRF